MREYSLGDTVVARATAPGGPIGIVRTSGPASFEIAASIFNVERPLEPRRVNYGWVLAADGAPIDEVVWFCFAGPDSFTGEDVLEVQGHGASVVLEKIVDRIVELGARGAAPGEFSYRAVLNGKMTASEAEGVAAIIAAKDAKEHERAIKKRQGKDLEWFENMHRDIQCILAEAELQIDFSDQGLEETETESLVAIQKKIQPPIDALSELLWLSETEIDSVGVQVYLVGAPNAGKSSLFNAFLGQSRAIVSPIAGTTRDLVSERLRVVDLEGRTTDIRLVDAAGIRKTEDIIEREGIDQLKRALSDFGPRKAVVVWVVDPTQEIVGQADAYESLGIRPTIGVFTKEDLWDSVSVERAERCRKQHAHLSWVSTSASRKEGLVQLRELLTESAGKVEPSIEVPIVRRKDQVVLVDQARNALVRSVESKDTALLAEDLREALRALSALFGEVTADDILKKIFSEFCIGK